MKIYVIDDNSIIEYYYENVQNYEQFVQELDEEFEEWYPTIESAESEICNCTDSIINTDKLLPQSCDIPFEFSIYHWSNKLAYHNESEYSRAGMLELLKPKFSKILFQKLDDSKFLVWVS